MSKLNIICYTADAETRFNELQAVCDNRNVNLEYEIDFSKLAGHVITNKPDILIFSLVDYRNSASYFKCFEAGSLFEVPMALVLGEIEPDFPLNLPSNFEYLKIDELADFFDKITPKIVKNCENKSSLDFSAKNYEAFLNQVLGYLGFNISTNGTLYLKKCVIEILLNKCVPSVTCGAYYRKLAARYNTTIPNVSRCIVGAISTAWKRYLNHRSREIFGISFSNFIECPKNKEFMYYLAHKISEYNRDQNFRNIF